MTAKEKLLLRVPDWTDEQAEIALGAVEPDAVEESEMAPLPVGWGETLHRPIARVRGIVDKAAALIDE